MSGLLASSALCAFAFVLSVWVLAGDPAWAAGLHWAAIVSLACNVLVAIPLHVSWLLALRRGES